MGKRAKAKSDDELLPEYDFSAGVRGKHAQQYQRGHTVKIHKKDGSADVRKYTLEDGAILLAPDVREYFSDAESVNRALRTLIELIPSKRRRVTGK